MKIVRGSAGYFTDLSSLLRKIPRTNYITAKGPSNIVGYYRQGNQTDNEIEVTRWM